MPLALASITALALSSSAFASNRHFGGGEPINDGAWMAHSTMMAIMGRMAAYTGQTIS